MTTPASMADQIEQRLSAALSPTVLRVDNVSWQHAGHAGDDGSGETHFEVEVESPAFAGLSRVARQRLVNMAVGELIAPGGIHALAVKARAPGETARHPGLVPGSTDGQGANPGSEGQPTAPGWMPGQAGHDDDRDRSR